MGPFTQKLKRSDGRHHFIMDRIVIPFGTFHTARTPLAWIGQRFGDAGFQYILMDRLKHLDR